MQMKKARDVKAIVIAIVIAFAMAVIMPFSGVKAEGDSNVITLTQEDFDYAEKNPGKAYKGITYNKDSGFEFAAGSYKLGSDIFPNYEPYYRLNFNEGLPHCRFFTS